MSSIHHGVAVVITNNQKNLFYIQQKDETYWIKRDKLKYCFFGGAVNSQEKEADALKRELLEELEKSAANLIIKNSNKIFNSFFKTTHSEFKKDVKFALFESILPEDELKKISQFPIKEGKCGKLIKKTELKIKDFMKDLKTPIKEYFKFIES